MSSSSRSKYTNAALTKKVLTPRYTYWQSNVRHLPRCAKNFTYKPSPFFYRGPDETLTGHLLLCTQTPISRSFFFFSFVTPFHLRSWQVFYLGTCCENSHNYNSIIHGRFFLRRCASPKNLCSRSLIVSSSFRPCCSYLLPGTLSIEGNIFPTTFRGVAYQSFYTLNIASQLKKTVIWRDYVIFQNKLDRCSSGQTLVVDQPID